jgi:hypothetical protein
MTDDELISPDEAIAWLRNEAAYYDRTIYKETVSTIEGIATRLESLIAERDALREVLGRLGSSEAMTASFVRRYNQEGLELLARIEYARAALNRKG